MKRCRLCAEVFPSSGVKEISKAKELLTKIQSTLPIVVIIGDTLPQFICLQCENQLNALSDFYEKTVRADLYLRSLKNFMPAETPSVVDPLLYFEDVYSLLTPAYKNYTMRKPNNILENFIVKILDETTLFSCKSCKRTYLSELSARSHFCKKEASSNSAMQSPSLPAEEKVQKDVPVIDISPPMSNEEDDGDIETVKISIPKEKKDTDTCQLSHSKVLNHVKRKNSNNHRKRRRSKVHNEREHDLICIEENTQPDDSGKEFRNEAGLTFHKHSHSENAVDVGFTDLIVTSVCQCKNDENGHKCSLCHLSFIRKSNVSFHEKSHRKKSVDPVVNIVE